MQVTIAFVDIVGFTDTSAQWPSSKVAQVGQHVHQMNLDPPSDQLCLFKIKRPFLECQAFNSLWYISPWCGSQACFTHLFADAERPFCII